MAASTSHDSVDSSANPSTSTTGSAVSQPLPRTPSKSFHGQGSIILWFRNDLRLRDNEALDLASTSQMMLPVYIFDERLYGPSSTASTKNGCERTGPFRARFIMQAVQDLNSSLEARGSRLLVRKGIPQIILAEIVRCMRHAGAPLPIRIVAQKEITHEEVRSELDVEKACASDCDCEVVLVWGSTLHHPQDFPLLLQGLFAQEITTTFTQYRKQVESIHVRPEFDTPERLVQYPRQLDEFYRSIIPSLTDLGVEELDKTPDERGVITFIGGETYALARLKEFIWDANALPKYKSTRHKSGIRDSSSKLSPWLALGCISARSVYWEACKYETERSLLCQGEKDKEEDPKYWFVFHLHVRDYFRWVAFRSGTKLFGGYMSTPTYANIDTEALQKWIQGRTGMRFVDASMRELRHTGYISNRSRQIVSSYLINDMKYPDWRAGAEYFEYILVDYDVASNWCNWASLAGVPAINPTRPYRFDVLKQAKRHDPDGVYQDTWCPLDL